jgi:predicted Rossmann-fold nucleotide-binding protein
VRTERVIAVSTLRVIAVFGGTADSEPSPSGKDTDPCRGEVKACAKQLGSAITAEDRHVLLTGGNGPKDKGAKGCAIAGAVPNRWVGVLKEPPGPGEPMGEKEGGLVIPTGLKHKRNYLEASMIDAAVALPGGDGTVSEVTSALSLKRPVAFVGNWAEYNLKESESESDRSAVLDKMVKTTLDLFKRQPANAGIDERLTKEVLRRALDSLPPCEYFKLCDAQKVVEWIESHVPRPGLDLFEDLRIAGLEKAARCYEDWLRCGTCDRS